MTLNRGERAWVARRLANAITCIPIGHQKQKQLTEEEVYSQLSITYVRPTRLAWAKLKDGAPGFPFSLVSVIPDDHTGWSWLVADEKTTSLIKSRLQSKPLKGYTTREVQQREGEWHRLEQKLVEDIESRKLQATSSSRRASERTRSPVPQPTKSRPPELETSSTELLAAYGEPSGSSSSSTSIASSEKDTPATPTVIGTSNSHGSDSVSQNLVTLHHKKQRTELSSPLSPSPTLPSSPFDKLPFEMIAIILKLCFNGLESPRAHLRMLHNFHWVGGPIRRVLSRLPTLWTTIHPASSTVFITTAIDLSQSYPLSIEYVPKPERSKGGWQGVECFIQMVQEARDRWESVNATVNPKSFAALTRALEKPAPLLRSLRVSVTDAGWVLDSPRLGGRSIGTPFQLLGGKQGNLRHLKLQNTPCFFDPTPFTLLTSIVLADGVRMRYQDVLNFLSNSTQLEELGLVDVKFIGVPPHELEQPLLLPDLKQLVLGERLGENGILNLFHSIRATNCDNLSLEVQGVEQLLGQKLVESVAPIIRKTFETDNATILHFRHHQRLNAVSWEGAGEGDRPCGFRLGFIGDGLAQAIVFPDFVNRVLPLVGGACEIKLNVEDLLSGTIRGTIGFEDIQATPTLLPSLFQTLTVTEVVAEVVDGYSYYLKEFVAPDLRKGFPALRCVTLRAIPSDEVVVKPDPAVQCRLEDFIDAISQTYYGVAPGEEVPAEKRNSLSVKLEGRFGVEAATQTELVGGRVIERAGIRVEGSGASVYCI
ncbi:hypothetical protein M407DRAFT_12791 [Tulasnella calospora MUT 4182]|uniref:Uncharacterized protein n=1 Tax=Tulasnella calospora MUT 4182 TaxID=1051891 RepID=A0A0C3Q1M2_9AGAM|nr:hypothetical protein M407DRAFT_12791 [Tulasnella calospora MUT 4182]